MDWVLVTDWLLAGYWTLLATLGTPVPALGTPGTPVRSTHALSNIGTGLRLEPFTQQPLTLDIMVPELDPSWTQYLNHEVLPYRRDSSFSHFCTYLLLTVLWFRAEKCKTGQKG